MKEWERKAWEGYPGREWIAELYGAQSYFDIPVEREPAFNSFATPADLPTTEPVRPEGAHIHAPTPTTPNPVWNWFMKLPFMQVPGEEAPQESHMTSIENVPEIAAANINPDLCAEVTGAYEGWLNKVSKDGRGGFLFHTRWGWKDYVVLEPPASGTWYIGWVDDATGAQMNRLPLIGPVRMLRGPIGTLTRFFAVNEDGLQIQLSIKDYGTLGDGKHPTMRLL